jgi:hypothetical protein
LWFASNDTQDTMNEDVVNQAKGSLALAQQPGG